MAPGSCTTGIHILLEELELCFEVYIVNIPREGNFSDEFLNLNPKATIPVLVTDDGQVITEFVAIVFWLAQCYPARRLLPGNVNEATRVMENLSYIVDTLHGQGFSRIFATHKYTENEAEVEAVQRKGYEIIADGFSILDKTLGDQSYLLENFSIADAAIFYIEFWADKLEIRLPPNCLRHYHTMLSRPTIKRVLMEEGYHSVLREHCA